MLRRALLVRLHSTAAAHTRMSHNPSQRVWSESSMQPVASATPAAIAGVPHSSALRAQSQQQPQQPLSASQSEAAAGNYYTYQQDRAALGSQAQQWPHNQSSYQMQPYTSQGQPEAAAWAQQQAQQQQQWAAQQQHASWNQQQPQGGYQSQGYQQQQGWRQPQQHQQHRQYQPQQWNQQQQWQQQQQQQQSPQQSYRGGGYSARGGGGYAQRGGGSGYSPSRGGYSAGGGSSGYSPRDYSSSASPGGSYYRGGGGGSHQHGSPSRPYSQQQSPQQQQQQQPKPFPPYDPLRPQKMLVLVAPPGAGKSFLSERVMREAREQNARLKEAAAEAKAEEKRAAKAAAAAAAASVEAGEGSVPAASADSATPVATATASPAAAASSAPSVTLAPPPLPPALPGSCPNWLRVNQDSMGSRRACEIAAERALRDGLSVIVDRTNIDPPQRATWISLARRAGIRDIECIWLRIPIEICKARVLARVGHETLPPTQSSLGIVERFMTDLVPPSLAEGFARIHTLGYAATEEEREEQVKEIVARMQAFGPEATSSAAPAPDVIVAPPPPAAAVTRTAAPVAPWAGLALGAIAKPAVAAEVQPANAPASASAPPTTSSS